MACGSRTLPAMFGHTVVTKEAPDHPGAAEVARRREMVFLILTGLFIGSMTMLNILGISRFLDLSFEVAGVKIPLPLAVGVLPYPLTFLCTDFISEIYGRRRANAVVWVGLLVNVWLALVMWVGGLLPGFDQPVPDAAGRLPVFFEIRLMTLGTIVASMVAYISAQFCDVYLFHFWKKLTKGKHLWLRNNGSTMVSQMVDTVAVILIAHFLSGSLPIEATKALWPQLWVFIATGYLFKLVAAALDTIPFYFGVAWMRKYLHVDDEISHG